MPYGGNDWLALTQEPTLEPEIPICDPHHHFWDLRPERIPYQRYLLHELTADINCGHNVRSTVFIETRGMYRPDGPVEMRPVGEVEFVQGLAAASASGLYGPGRAAAAIVGHANLNLGDRVKPVLETLRAASPNRFRGIRHTVTWDPHPEIENREKEGVLATADYRTGARVLARMGLSLDTGVCFPQLPELAAFAKSVPDLTIILNHLGGLTRIGPYANRDDEVLTTWRRGLAAVAACPNVSLKLGGIGMPRLGFDWHEWSCTCPMRINIAGSPVDRQRVKKFYTRGLSWPPSGPLTPGDALKTSRADTPTPRQLTATRRSLSCALFLTPLRAAATAARGRAAPRAGSTHGRSAPRPWLASGAATAWPSRCHGWVRTAAAAGVRRRVANRSYSTHDTMRAAGVSPPHLCR